jgi:hypothetical protein
MKTFQMLTPLLVSLGLLLGGNHAHAAFFQVSTSDSYPPAPPKTWNPREDDNLVAVMSAATDVSINQSGMGIDGHFYTMTYHGQAAAATYGSDTSANWIVDPRLEGKSIEPMADTMATTKMECLRDGDPWDICSGVTMGAYGMASVNHRVVRTGYEGGKITHVPLYVEYKLSATSSKAEGPDKSEGEAEVSMGALRVIVDTNPQDSCPPGARCYLNEFSERVRFTATTSTDDDIVPFLITAKAYAGAVSSVEWGNRTLDGYAQAVADPFVYVDPDWEFAEYFMVQQESLLHPGEWVEVTRIWTEPIPEPETWAML